MAEEDHDRVEGVDFADINPLLDEISYPITADDFVERYGDRELERTNAAPITVRELFEYMGDDTFESAEQLRQMILAQMPRGSEGRPHYSDRGGSNPTLTEDAEDAEDVTSADLEEGNATDPDAKQDRD